MFKLYIIHWNGDKISLDPLLITNYCIDVQILVFIYLYAGISILLKKSETTKR
jgi:hypothetical protein